MTAETRPGLPLGVGVPPADGDELSRRVAASLREGAGGVRIERLPDSAVTASVAGFDIVELAIDITGAHLAVPSGAADDAAGDDVAAPEGVTVGRGVAHRIRVQGAPVVISDAPVAVDVDLREVPIRWVRRQDDTLELCDELDSPDSPGPQGRARLSVARDAVPLLVEGLVRDAAGPDLRLREAALSFSDEGQDAVAVAGDAHVSMAGLGARVQISGVVRVAEGTRIRVDGFDIRSRNILAAAALAAVRSRIAEAASQELDLTTVLPVGLSGARVGIAAPDGGLELAATFD